MANRITAVIDVVADKARREVKSFRQSVQEADGAVGKMKAGSKSLAASLRANAGASAAVAGAALIKFGADAVSAASNLEESQNAVNVAFGKSAEGVRKLGENSVEAYGLSERAFNEASTALSGFTTQIAGANGDVAGTLDNLVGRATDFASVFNMDVTESLQVFQSALAGETEPIRKFGIDMSAAAVEAHALATGLVESKSEMTEAIKVQARYSLLMRETSETAGDFANTQESLANQSRTLQANIEDLQASIGEHLVPAISEAVAGFNEMIDFAGDNKVISRLDGFNTAIRGIFVPGKQDEILGGIKQGFTGTAESADDAAESVEELERKSWLLATVFGEMTRRTETVAYWQRRAEVELKATAEAEEAAAEAAAELSEALAEQAEEVEELTGLMGDLVGVNLDVEKAQLDAADAVDEYADRLKEIEESSDSAEKKERDRERALIDATQAQLGAAEAATDYKVAQMEASGAAVTAQDRNRILAEQIGSVARTLAPGSPIRANLEGYAAELRAIPDDVESVVRLDVDESRLQSLRTRLESILGRSITIPVNTYIPRRGTSGAPPNAFAKGTQGAPPGYAWVGEQGPELMNLPAGTVVRDAERSQQMTQGPNRGGNVYMTFTAPMRPDDVAELQRRADRRNGRL